MTSPALPRARSEVARRFARPKLWLALLCLALPSCAPAERPNILLVSLDTLRADSLGSHGYPRDTTPFLDELAAEGLRFDKAFVVTLATTPSHVSILSSQYQESHGVLLASRKEEGAEAAIISPTTTLLPEVMAEAGYLTLAVTDGGRFRERFGFGRGFAEFDGSRARGIVRGAERLLAMLDRHGEAEAPLFVLYHTYEIHAPYDPPPPYDSLFGEGPESDFVPSAARLREVIDTAGRDLTPADLERIRLFYDRGIRFTDDGLRRLFEGLAERGFFDRDHLVVVTSDHGEEFGERGGVLHRGLLYEEFLHVPLILKGSRVPVGEVRSDLVSSLDIAPTILAYAGLDVPDAMQGVDLLGRPPLPAERQRIIAQYRNTRYALRTPGWKYIASGRPELYHLTADPGERENLAARHPERVDEFQSYLDRWREAQAERRPSEARTEELTAEELEEMRALGYVN